MKIFNKKSISLVLIFTILMAIFMPAVVNAEGVGRVGIRVTFNETATDSEEVESSTNMEQYINSKKDDFSGALADGNVTANASNSNVDPDTLFSTSEPYKYATITSVDTGYAMLEGTLTQTHTISYTTVTVTKKSDSNITRKTVTNYHTKVEGTLNITGANTYTKNYSSGEDYLDGNYSDAEIAAIINDYKQDIQTIVESYNATSSFTISEGISDYYYDAHDEITQSNNGSDVIQVGDINDMNHAYANQGQITITTILDKYQTYKINAKATSVSATSTQITGANVTLAAPKVGDSVAKITKDDGYGEYEAQSVQPTVSTTTEGLTVNAFWVMGLEALSEESFYGTFENDTYYYALIDFEAQEGYELPSTFPDGIKINGQAPAEVFAVMGGKWNHCVAKIKATNEEVVTPTFGHNNIWTVSGGQVAVLYENRDAEQTALDGNTWVEKGHVVDFKVGDSITVKAKENEGFKFIGWYVSDVQKGADYYNKAELVSTEATYTYQPTITTVNGIEEPINYLTAAFEENMATTPAYEFIDNTANQTYTIDKDETLTFRINAEYSQFENGGKVLIDNKETKEITSKSGSTIITLNKEFADSLAVGEHTIEVDFNDGGSATTKFKIAKAETEQEDKPETETKAEEEQEETKTEPKADEEIKEETPATTPTEATTAKEPKSGPQNPQTGDSILICICLMMISVLGIIVTKKILKK